MDSDDDQQMDTDSGCENEDDSHANQQNTQHLIGGKIATVHLKNFLTHTELTVRPSEQLNLIIGPNGTGKSSIVASIIIGMGGSTKILSERNKLADYVKNGKDVAEITVTLYKDERRNRIEFRREFNRQNKSTYHIDGRKVTEKDYCAQINALNIQVGNLCQFLPQERVQDFAKQNPHELFASTQKSVCSDEMCEQFDKLKELRTEQLCGDKQLKRTAELLHDNERRLETLQSAVDNIRRQDALVQRKNVIEKKLAWMDFEDLYVKCKEIDKDLTTAKEKHQVELNKKREFEQLASDKARERQKYEKSLGAEVTKKKKCVDELQRITGEIEKLESALQAAQNDLDAHIRNARDHDQNVNECRIILETYEEECANHLETIGSAEQIQNQMADIDRQVNETREKIKKFIEFRNKLNYQIEHVYKPSLVNIDQKMAAFSSVADTKLNFLKEKFPDTYAGVMWLRKNKGMFRGRIYEPMIIELNVRSNEYCKYIENCVKFQDLLAFTCEETEDMTQFLKILRIDQKLQVNAVHSAAIDELRFKPTVPLNDVRRYGGEIYLIDCIDAPLPILKYLCSAYRIHDVLIGNENLERKLELLPSSLMLFFTQTHRNQVKISKYSGLKSMLSSEIRTKNLLNVRVNPREMDKLQQDKEKMVRERDNLYNKRNELEGQINMFEAQCKTHFQEKSEHNKRILEMERLRKRVAMQQQKLKRLEEQPIDVDGERERFERTAKEICKKIIKFNENSITVYDKMLTIELNEVKARARLNIFKNSNANFDAELLQCNDEIERIKSYCDRIGTILDRTKQETKEKQLIAMKLTENRKPSEGDKFPYKQQFDALSNDRAALNEEMEDLEQQINCHASSDQSVLDEYRKLEKTIDGQKKELKKGDKSAGEITIEINALHNKWFPRVQRIVKSINRNFGEFMQSMNCAGEVDLVYPSDRDYDKYGIEIRVKYRASEKLRALDRFVQSGGERAVAIAVYSLSLQHLSQVPFRCVDEINQGMDPNNERRVFDMLVKNVSQPGQAQFFYVTPKLQEMLPFNEHVTCITVFNGPYTNHNDFFEDVDDD